MIRWSKCNEGNFFAHSPKLFVNNFNAIIVSATVNWLRKGWEQEVGSAYYTKSCVFAETRGWLRRSLGHRRSRHAQGEEPRSRGEQVTLQWLPHVCLIAGPGSAQPGMMGTSLLELRTECHNASLAFSRRNRVYGDIHSLCSIIGLPVKPAGILEHYYLLGQQYILN